MQLAPSKNPAKEAKMFSIMGLVFGIAGLVVWFMGIPGLAFSLRGLILANQVNNSRQRTMAIIGLILSVIDVGYYFVAVV